MPSSVCLATLNVHAWTDAAGDSNIDRVVALVQVSITKICPVPMDLFHRCPGTKQNNLATCLWINKFDCRNILLFVVCVFLTLSIVVAAFFVVQIRCRGRYKQ